MSLYKRIITATIGIPGQEALLVENLRIDFTVKQTGTSESNTATIKITNLSEQSRERINKTEDIIILQAGYENSQGAEEIFKGTFREVNHAVSPPDIITTLQCEDGKDTLNKEINLSFNEDTQIQAILEEIKKTVGVVTEPKKLSTLEKLKRLVIGGFSHIGKVKDAVDKLAQRTDLEWSILDEDTMKFVELDKSDGSPAIVLAPGTGLIGYPERIYAKKTKSGKIQKGSFDGWRVVSLLQPRAVPGGVIQLETRDVSKSQFKIINVKHAGNNFTGDFFSTIEAQDVG